MEDKKGFQRLKKRTIIIENGNKIGRSAKGFLLKKL